MLDFSHSFQKRQLLAFSCRVFLEYIFNAYLHLLFYLKSFQTFVVKVLFNKILTLHKFCFIIYNKYQQDLACSY